MTRTIIRATTGARCLLLAVVAIGASSATAADIKVIANSSVGATSVSSDELKGVFLATKSSLSDGSHVEPVLLKGGAVHEAFLKDYVGKTDSGLETYYRSLVFTGKGSMPKTFATDAEVVAFVEKTKGAIGYVAAATATASAKVLEVK
jgi:ABC-type phosphate transport system substrate-binding protein